MSVVAMRIIKQIVHDKRSVAMILIVPIVLLTLLYLLLSPSGYTPHVLVYAPQAFADALTESDRITVAHTPLDKGELSFSSSRPGIPVSELLEGGEADAVLLIPSFADGIFIYMLEPDSVKLAAITEAVKEASASLSPQSQMTVKFLRGDAGASTFDSYGFLLLAVMSFFLIFIFSGVSFVRERTADTVERLMLTPVKTASVVGGYVLGFGLFAVVQSALMILFAKTVLNMTFTGAWPLALLIMLLVAVLAVVLGVLISALAKNEFQVMQFIPVIIIPQVFFSGLIPVDTLPYGLNHLSKTMPLYYGSQAMKGVLVYGYGLVEILPQIAVLTGIIALLFACNILAVRRYRAV
ncbi:MAG: ABC transporter permease [Oscillospiraceae bacterium]|nr:ABC transporter permease [Oscillospiraceae bacterium]